MTDLSYFHEKIDSLFFRDICPVFSMKGRRNPVFSEKISEFSKKLLSDIFFHYRGVFRTQSKIYDGFFGENSQAKRFHLRYLTGSKYVSALVLNFSEVFSCFNTFMGKR